jgi:hypothetical protein
VEAAGAPRRLHPAGRLDLSTDAFSLLAAPSAGEIPPPARTGYDHFLSENGSGRGGAVAVTDIHGERLVVALPVEPDVVQGTSPRFAAR